MSAAPLISPLDLLYAAGVALGRAIEREARRVSIIGNDLDANEQRVEARNDAELAVRSAVRRLDQYRSLVHEALLAEFRQATAVAQQPPSRPVLRAVAGENRRRPAVPPPRPPLRVVGVQL